MQQAPAAIGDSVESADTPALLLDLDIVERNIARVHGAVSGAGLAVRPHGKAHKSPDLALMQMEAGAVGICCQKVSEAEVFAAAGIDDILITNQVIGERKVTRLAELAAHAKVAICVDHLAQIEQLARALEKRGTRLDVLIEVDIGHGRCGVKSADEALLLAEAIRARNKGLRLTGIHAFRGSAQHMRAPGDRATAVQGAVERINAVKAALAQASFHCATVTGGGTGTYQLEAASQVYTEVQPGSYVLMDTDYAANQLAPGEAALGHALSVLCSVISVQEGYAVLDGGLKTFAVDQGLPRILASGWTVKSLSDEHAVITASPTAAALAVGHKVRLLPSHCDPTVNLHDWLVAYRGDRVEALWPVAARGAIF